VFRDSGQDALHGGADAVTFVERRCHEVASWVVRSL
jgi:hypothetical protein